MNGSGSNDFDPSYDVVQLLASDAPVGLTTGDLEPIHQSGAIQPHGVLLALTEPDLVITWTSENTGIHLGKSPSQVVDRTLAAVLGESASRQLTDRLQEPLSAGTDPFSFQVASGATLDATWHRLDGLVIVELEPAIRDSGALMSLLFADVRHAMQALQSTDSVHTLCDAAARAIRQLTGHDRVMVYRFHPDGHGEVVAEQKESHQRPFLGLHFPTTDILCRRRGSTCSTTCGSSQTSATSRCRSSGLPRSTGRPSRRLT